MLTNENQQIHIYHINDLHSHFENWPKIRRFLRQKKEEHQANGENVFIFDIGDFLDRVHPLTETTNGKANIELMNQIGFDAVTIGNNEGIGNTKDVLNRLYQDANFPVLLANLVDLEDSKQPDWAQESLVLSTPEGFRIGLVGITAPLYLSYLPNGWQPKESFEVLPLLLQELAPQVDMIILLSHMGIIEDEHMAEMYQDIDLILGAHTHHVLPEGKLIDNCLLTGGGKWGAYIGHSVVTVSPNHDVIDKKTELIHCNELAEWPLDQSELDRLYQKGIQQLTSQVVADMPIEFQSDWYHSTNLVQLGLEAITEFASIDIGLLNAGLFLDSLAKGVVTKADLHRMLPHPMRLIRCKMLGKDFCRMVFDMEDQRDELRIKTVMGMGFRGKVFGELCYKGIKVDVKMGVIYYNGTVIKDNDNIEFVTVDHYRYVSFFPLIEKKGESELLFPHFLRDVVGQYLEKHFPISYSK